VLLCYWSVNEALTASEPQERLNAESTCYRICGAIASERCSNHFSFNERKQLLKSLGNGLFNVQRIITRYFIKTILCQFLSMMSQNCFFLCTIDRNPQHS
jgi:hypothetical protein